MQTEVMPTNQAAAFKAAVSRAADLLRSGKVVALPTETVYGLAANAFDPTAVQHIFNLKGRPAHNPIIVHVAGLELAKACTNEWPASAEALATAFWPGPLTLVLPRSERIPDIVTAGGITVGVRWPSHPFIQEVIRVTGLPLAAPSANRSNQISPTNAAHVLKDLGGSIPLIVDGGQSQVGIESTVVDLTGGGWRVLRPGMIDANAIAKVLGDAGCKQNTASSILRSPGMLLKHYSPKAKLILMRWTDEEDFSRKVASFPNAREKIHIIAHHAIPLRQPYGRVSVIPEDAEAYARALYAELHQCDEGGAELILVEAPPSGSEWQGITDRLNRASNQGNLQ